MSGLAMGDRHDYVALEWVKGEIAETLKQARLSLEEHVGRPDDAESLQSCLDDIHQVHGTLQMVEFFGAALLAEEMEMLAQALLNDQVVNVGEAREVLMTAILQLPLYLERIQSARRDLPMAVLPLLNDLRAARGEKFLSQSSLFNPRLPAPLPPLDPVRRQQLDVPQLSGLLRKIRQTLQIALIGLLREEDVPQSLLHMARVFAGMEKLSRGAPLLPLWQVAAGLVDGLANQSVELTTSVRSLLRQLDARLRMLVKAGASGLNEHPPEDLLKNLLFYVAKAQANSDRLQRLYREYDLEGALPREVRDADAAADRDTIRSVVTALCEELVRVKDSLDIFVRGDRSSPAGLESLQVPLKQIADTLAVLGFAQQRKVIIEQANVLEAIAAGTRAATDANLMDVAGALLYLEATLIGMVGAGDSKKEEISELGAPTDVLQVHRLVIREARTGLEQAKDGIIEFIASQWQHQYLEPVSELLNQVRGGLGMIPLKRAAQLVDSSKRYIDEQLLENRQVPGWQDLDTLADAITSVDYYLERLHEDRDGDNEKVLETAAQSLAALGYPIADLAAGEEEQYTEAADSTDTVEDAVDELARKLLEEHAPERDMEEELQDVLEAATSSLLFTLQEADTSSLSLDVDSAEPEEDTGLEDFELPEVSLPEAASKPEKPVDEAEKITLDAPVSQLNPPATEIVEQLLPPPEGDEPIDEELREIFVEEAGEVLETLHEQYPQWQKERNDQHALTEVRRAFHTLKGSGRMVRALVVGELAWSIENMLNRVLEGSVESEPPVLQVVADVMALLPELVGEYADRQQRQRDDVDRLAATAHALARKLPVPVFDLPEQEPELEVEGLEPEDSPALVPAGDDTDGQPVQDDIVEDLVPPLEEAADMGESDEDEEEVDPQLIEIFHGEAWGHLKALKDFIADCDFFLPRSVSDALQRALHTLKGSAHMAGIIPVAQLATALEKLAKEYRAHLLPIGEGELPLLKQSLELLELGVEQVLDTPMQPLPGGDELVVALQEKLQRRLADSQQNQDPSGPLRDPLLISRFMEEGMNLLLDMDDHLESWRSRPAGRDELASLQEELQALRQSAEMAELEPVTELVDGLAGFYRYMDDNQLQLDDARYAAAANAHEALISMMDQVAAGLDVSFDPQQLLQLQALTGTPLADADIPQVPDATIDELLQEAADSPQDETASEDRDEAEDAVWEEIPDRVAGNDAAVDTDEDRVGYDSFELDMVEIFLEEAVDLLDSANLGLEQWQESPDNQALLMALMRDLHTLKGGARMAGIGPVGDLAHELEALYEGLIDGRYTGENELLPALLGAHDELALQLEQLQAGQDLVRPTGLIERLQVFRKGITAPPIQTVDALSGEEEPPVREPEAPQPAAEPKTVRALPVRDAELVEIFLEEAFEVLERMSTGLENWLTDTGNMQPVEVLQRDLHTLKGGARMAEIDEVANLAHELEYLYEDLTNGRLQFAKGLGSFLHEAHDLLTGMLEAVCDEQPAPDETRMVERARNWRSGNEETTQGLQLDSEQDAELLGVFAIEAAGQTADLPAQLPEDETVALAALATLKGGAELAGLEPVTRCCVQLEETLNRQDAEGWTAGRDKLLEELAQLREAVPDVEPAALEQLMAPAPPVARQTDSRLPVAELEVEERAQQAGELLRKALPFMQQAQEASRARGVHSGPQEQVRIPAELLEGLVNLAGETSIFRGRVEQQVSDFGFTLNEMETTLDRIRDQLRRLDTETQAQILSRYQTEVDGVSYADFDPLEMDRHSQLQQLSRSLFESASDLLDLKETLAAKSRDAETLLLQQARVNTELQEGLMRTRMVPFERLVPRLRRIVRQVSAELGKQVELQVANAEGEMDRSVMERMVAPLEHMLRNAVGHGIEDPQTRLAAGKPATGTIRLELGREGADILLIISDDGAGVNVDAVRKKAVARGMISENSALNDHEVIQFILRAGFSTAEQVTQVSGRGVGMDVVSSEIKQVGGSISIESERGRGTSFLLRLPFTVSVNRALMVMTGEDLYAIPLNTVEGIVRVSPYELEALYEQAEQGEPARFEYAGQQYDLRYLGDLLVNGQQPKLVGQLLPLPVVLVRSAEHAVAVQVDSLAGSREIVVKSLGPQFANVPSLSGATILGDGRVVVILDLMAAIRDRYLQPALPVDETLLLAEEAPPAEDDSTSEEGEQLLQVMVVDDSVTVRKVTSRLLERYGMQVTTAKDGVDAINQLQEHKPDIMLLDIEMPRMDGFEVATLVRRDERLRDLPIIMITSRTGDKHRQRAMEIGVNEYLGKPYQEAQLLETIQQLTE